MLDKNGRLEYFEQVEEREWCKFRQPLLSWAPGPLPGVLAFGDFYSQNIFKAGKIYQIQDILIFIPIQKCWKVTDPAVWATPAVLHVIIKHKMVTKFLTKTSWFWMHLNACQVFTVGPTETSDEKQCMCKRLKTFLNQLVMKMMVRHHFWSFLEKHN